MSQVPDLDSTAEGRASPWRGDDPAMDGIDINLQLTKASDWGVAKVGKPEPPILPRNPHGAGLPTLKTHSGDSLRSRPFVLKRATKDRTRLPPPPLGHTMGHGLPTPGDMLSPLDSSTYAPVSCCCNDFLMILFLLIDDSFLCVYIHGTNATIGPV